MKIKQLLSVGAIVAATAALATPAHAGISGEDFNSAFNKGGGKVDNGGSNNGGNGGNNGGNGGFDAISNLNNTANSLASPTSNATNNATYANLAGNSYNVSQSGGFSNVKINGTSCPRPNLSLIASGNGVFKSNSFDDNDAWGFGGGAVLTIPFGGKDAKRCSDHLALQTDDMYFAIGFKATRACIEFAKEGVTQYDLGLWGDRAGKICNDVAGQVIAKRQPVIEYREKIIEVPVIKEVIKEVPVPVHPPVQKHDLNNG